MIERDADRIRKLLIQWYRNEHRSLPWRTSSDPYQIWVSEVMLQQTRVKTVVPYFRKFISVFPDVAHLARAELQTVLKLWEGMGYYARARNLHRAARQVLELFAGRIPATRKELLQLPGIGDYIASAVLSIAFDQPYAVVDGNVKRVLARMFRLDAPVNQARGLAVFKATADKLLDFRHPGIFNQAIMELGAVVCKPRNPKCEICPLQGYCAAFKVGSIHKYPLRVTRSPIPKYHIAVGVIYREDRVLITRRPTDGLLGGLWEFPGGKIGKGEDSANGCLREIQEEVGLDVTINSHLMQVKHAYTHFRIVMEVFRCQYTSGEVELKAHTAYRWVKPEELDRFPFPRANLKFMHLLDPSGGKDFGVKS